MKLKRAIYLGYYLKQLDREKFLLFLRYVKNNTGKSTYSIFCDILNSVFAYNISPLEYFQFHFYSLSKEQRNTWAGTGYMYEFQLKMNPKSKRSILADKTLFYKHYDDFLAHTVADIEDIKNKNGLAKAILSNPSGKLVLKSADGKCGEQVVVKSCDKFDESSLAKYMENGGYDLVEEFVTQHPDLNRLSPSAVNTVRVFTQLNCQNEVEILGCRLRISVDSHVDNLAAGNMAAPIDERTGRLSGAGVYSDITKGEKKFHPTTNMKIPGFQIPFWEDTITMVRKAAKLHPQNRSIGWDIVITENGPGLIEGNHDWCKLLWQLPVQKGLKPLLEMYTRDSTDQNQRSGKS